MCMSSGTQYIKSIDTPLMASFPGQPFAILMKQEMMGWQWHQLDHMQIICTSLWTDNHASNLSTQFLPHDAMLARYMP